MELKSTSQTPISVVLPTIFRKELIKSTLSSIVPQLKEIDELLISLNVHSDQKKECETILKEYVDRLREFNFAFELVGPEKQLKVYEHWNFAISKARNDNIAFIHDDEIYNHNLLAIAREEFGSDSKISLVTGGQINVYSGKLGISSHKEISFAKRRVFETAEWIESQSNRKFPKFGATAYIFRRQSETYWFFEQNTRVSDGLMMYHLAMIGRVVERPEFFGTHLEHSGNSMQTDYLETNHTPYWQGMNQLGHLTGCSYLREASALLKSEVSSTYSRCALLAAIPLRNKEGYLECLRQCSLAGTNPTLALRIIDGLPFKWQLLPPIIKAIKQIKRKIDLRRLSFDLESELILAELLGVSLNLVTEFKRRALSHLR
ncbi:MAG: glycosyltransferase family 2 protein [Verrucomicrobiaceae bacterium]|nr:MAG: glycosyltransferase family 2 protein [Verrucomicrobiaceae bacterium]